MQKLLPIRITIMRLAIVTVAAAALVALFTHTARVNQTTVAMVFLVLILLTAYRWRLVCSVYLSVLCTLLYNFFFLPPVGRLTVADPQNWVALSAFLAASVLVSHLSERERRQTENSERRRREVDLLYQLSQKLLVQDEVREIARNTPAILTSIFGFNAVALYVAAADTAFYSDPDRILAPAADLRAITLEQRDAMEVLGGTLILPLRMGVRHSLGTLAIAGGPESHSYVEAVASVVSVALERAAALERSARAEAARESERLRAALVDSVTHDLRTPLTAVRAAATALLDSSEMSQAQQSELVEVINDESRRLDRLIGQAIEMARLDSETLRPNLAPQDARELVEVTLDRMQSVLRGHSMQVEIVPNLPRVRMDRALMERVLQHLLENAAAYSAEGQTITVSATRDAAHLVLTVADNGQGIEAEDLPFLFDKYFRGKRQKGQSRGTGMGLAIARAMAKAHGGDITVESKPGRGSTFRVSIPLA
ncbi:MAG: ATP-binding protein [Acidobacteriota bacterium]